MAKRPDPHTAVMRELLVRYLDAWTPAVLRSHRRATYVAAGRDDFAGYALRVFGEFADRLAGTTWISWSCGQRPIRSLPPSRNWASRQGCRCDQSRTSRT